MSDELRKRRVFRGKADAEFLPEFGVDFFLETEMHEEIQLRFDGFQAFVHRGEGISCGFRFRRGVAVAESVSGFARRNERGDQTYCCRIHRC